MDAFIERQIASFGGRRFARPDDLDMRKYPNFVRIRVRDNKMEADPVVAALAAMRPDMDMRDFRRLNGFRDGCDYYANTTNTVYLCYVRHAKDKPDTLELEGASRRRADSNESRSERSAEQLEDITSQTWRVERLIEMNKPRT